jgi:hypothetical protein
LSVTGTPAQGQCFSGTVGTSSLGSACDLTGHPAAVPASWHFLSNGPYQGLMSGVAPDVAYVVLTLSDGHHLKLTPATAGGGGRFVGIVVPQGSDVTTETAYLANGREMPVEQSTPPGWTRPSPAALSVATADLGPVRDAWQGWTSSAQEGPWGTCFATGDGEFGAMSCTTAAPLTTLTAIGAAQAWDGSPAIVYGSAPPATASLTVTLAGGHSLHVPVQKVGEEHLWAFSLGNGQVIKSWTAFSASGKQLGTGRPDPPTHVTLRPGIPSTTGT